MSTKRSAIPVLGKSGIPVKRSNIAVPQSRGNSGSSAPAIAGRTERVSSLPNVLRIGSTKKSADSDVAKDSKLVEETISKLQKQIEDKDEALTDLNKKLALKTQECDALEEERNTIRQRTSDDLQKVTMDCSHLNESLKEREKAMQDMESKHAEEKEKISFELDVLRSEHLIEVEMLKKEMEHLKSKEDKPQLKRGLEFSMRPESEYDSSDVGSRDQSPAVEAMHEQLLTIQGSYEEEIGSLTEQLQAQIAKTNEVVEKLEQQEFEFNEKLSELKSRVQQDQDILAVEHQNEISNVRSLYEERLKLQEDRHKERKSSISTKVKFEPDDLGPNDVISAGSRDRDETIAALKVEHEVYMDAVKEQYEGELVQMKQQLAKKEKQFANREDQMADDMMTLHSEYERQLSDSRETFAKERNELEIVVSQLRSGVQELNDRHETENEVAQLRHQEELNGLQRVLQERQSMDEGGTESEDEIKKLTGELQKERKNFTEATELLESTITEQEQELAKREEEHQKLSESHQTEKENLKTDNEKNLQEASERHLKEIERLKEDHKKELRRTSNTGDYSADERGGEVERLLQEIKELRMRHEQELKNLHETQAALQTENEELKNQFDLVIGDLSEELKNSTNEPKQTTQQNTAPQMLRAQLDILREQNKEKMRVILEQQGVYKERVSSLEDELGNYKEGKEESNNDKHKIEELESELDVLTQKCAAETKYNGEVDFLQTELERFKVNNQELANAEANRTRKVVELEDVIEELKISHSCYVEEYEGRITEFRNEKKRMEGGWQKEKEDHEKEVLQLETKLDELKEKHANDNEVYKEEIKASELKISQLTNTINDLQEDFEKYQEEKKGFESEATEQRRGSMETSHALKAQLSRYEEKIAQLTRAMEEVELDCAVYKKKSVELEDQNEGLRKASSEKKNALSKQLSVDYEDKIAQLTRAMEEVEQDCAVYKKKSVELEDQNEGLRKASSEKKNALSKQLLDYEDKIAQLTRSMEEVEQDCAVYKKKSVELEDQNEGLRKASSENKNALKKQLLDSEDKIAQLTRAMEEVEQDCAVYRKKSAELEDQNEGLRKASSDTNNQLLDYEEKISQFEKTIDVLKNECREQGMKTEILRDKLEQLPNSESTISSASVQEVLAENSGFNYEDRVSGGIALEYEQQNKELVEEFENKIEALELQLSESKNAFLSKRMQMESVNAEMNALRQNLEDERKVVQNLEERLQKITAKHETEIKKLKENLVKETDRKQGEGSAMTSKTEEYSSDGRNVEAEFITNKNTELGEEIINLKEGFEEERKRYQADIYALQYNFEKGSRDVETLKVTLETASAMQSEKEADVARLKARLEANRLNHQNEMSAIGVRTSQEAAAADNLKADLKEARKINKKQEDELRRLNEQLQESVHKTNGEMCNIEERLKQGYNEDIGSLKADLEVALDANGRQSEEISKLEEEAHELQQKLAHAHANYSEEKTAVTEAHAQKLQALLKSRASETASLVSLLDTEQKGRERVLLDTEKHLAHVGRTEQEMTNMEREMGELRLRVKSLEKELETEKKNHARTLSQVKKKQQNEHEEVLSLNRSFNESEFERGKLVSEIEYWKEEAHKVQEKYKKLREKFGLMKEKRREDKEKHAEPLFTPRSDMQTDMLQIDELEQKASASMLEQSRLEEDIESLEHAANRMKVEMQALRKANGILRKQNQILYLETESLNDGGKQQRHDLTQLTEENLLLVKHKEKLTSENRSLNVVLEEQRQELDQKKDERSALDSENKNSQTELKNSQEKERELARENYHLKDENVFFVKQAKRLQSQVEHLENELQKSAFRYPAALSSSELVQSRPALPLMSLESKPQIYDENASPETKEQAAKLVDENHKLHGQMEALQKLLASKEQELQLTTNARQVDVDRLVKERQELLTQVESMKNSLDQTDKGKGFIGIKTHQVIEWDNKQKVAPSYDGVPLITDVDALRTGGAQQSNTAFQTSDNYLGTSYWEAMNFLKSMKSSS